MEVLIRIDDNVEYTLSELGWHCDFTDFEAPQTRTNYKTIPGRNGVLDLTEVDGQVYYEPVQFTLLAQRICRKGSDCATYLHQLMNLFNGKACQVFLFYDPDSSNNMYYDGRIQIGQATRDQLVFNVELMVTAYPYRYEDGLHTESFTISGTQTKTLHNLQMPVVPAITCSAAMTIVFNDTTWSINAGQNILLPNLVLGVGDSEISISGTGTISFTYQRGSM